MLFKMRYTWIISINIKFNKQIIMHHFYIKEKFLTSILCLKKSSKIKIIKENLCQQKNFIIKIISNQIITLHIYHIYLFCYLAYYITCYSIFSSFNKLIDLGGSIFGLHKI